MLHMQLNQCICLCLFIYTQVLVILFPSLEEIDTLVTYYCLVHNAVGSVLAQQTIDILGKYTVNGVVAVLHVHSYDLCGNE